MKKILSLTIITSLLLAFSACRDESLNPLPTFLPGVHAFTVFDGIAFNGNLLSRPQPYERANAKNFPKVSQNTAKVDFKTRWVSLDNKLTVNKIEIYVRMLESYNDPDGNPKVADLSENGKGKLITTISAPAANRQWNNFSISPQQIYDAYKNATVAYNKVTKVNVFSNPARPRPTDQWLRPAENATYGAVAADSFVVTWILYTADGQVFNTWNPDSVCADPTSVSEANSNCQLSFIVQ
jgi:hypothetical protein